MLQPLGGMRHLLLALIVLGPAIPRPGGACSALARDGGLLQNAPDQLDVAAPVVTAADATVVRSGGDDGGGCGTPKCSSGSFIAVDVAASDDRTAADQIGFTFRVTSGSAPNSLFLPTSAVLALDGGVLLPISSADRGFAFDLEVRAVDRNGGISVGTVLHIVDPSGS